MKLRPEIKSALDLAAKEHAEIWLGSITPNHAERQLIEGSKFALILKSNGYWLGPAYANESAEEYRRNDKRGDRDVTFERRGDE